MLAKLDDIVNCVGDSLLVRVGIVNDAIGSVGANADVCVCG